MTSRIIRVFALLAFSVSQAAAASLDLEFVHVADGAPLQLGSLRYRNSSDETFSVTRLSYLAGGFALEAVDGAILEFTNVVQWIDVEAGRTAVRINGVPAGNYRSLRFNVGVNPRENHLDPAGFPAGHPLNPNVNGLHWSWQGGFVFLAAEGLWRTGTGPMSGWSFHLARDPNLVLVHIPCSLVVSNDLGIAVELDVSRILARPHPISFAKDGASTHSREGDSLAERLRDNLRSAFRIREIKPVRSVVPLAVARRGDLPLRYTPYRFEISRQFPLPSLPADNPLIQERVTLGRALFSETRLSRDGSISCATCHDLQHAFSDSTRFSAGVGARHGARNAMPLFNLAWKSRFFWDGRARTLREQALLPIQDHAEMDESLSNVVCKLESAPPSDFDYPALFALAFATPEVTGERIGLALEQYLLTLTSLNSKFDRSLRGEAVLSAMEQRGFELFTTEYDPRRGQFGGDCFHCHGGALFQSQAFANNGLDEYSADPGRGQVTGKAVDNAKFATPSLRNVALTAPYMHDGRFKTLEEVVQHYCTGVKSNPNLDPNLAKHPQGGLHLPPADQRALVAFLKTLTDPQFTSH